MSRGWETAPRRTRASRAGAIAFDERGRPLDRGRVTTRCRAAQRRRQGTPLPVRIERSLASAALEPLLRGLGRDAQRRRSPRSICLMKESHGRRPRRSAVDAASSKSSRPSSRRRIVSLGSHRVLRERRIVVLRRDSVFSALLPRNRGAVKPAGDEGALVERVRAPSQMRK